MPSFFSDLPLWALFALFAGAAALVWLAGGRLVRQVDAITRKTGLGQAFAGMLFLGGITSLPELAAVGTSAAIGDAPLAVNNLLGSAAINVALLAVADIVYGRDALTRAAAKPSTLMPGVLSMMLAALVALLAIAGDIGVAGVGLGSLLLAGAALAALWISSDFEDRHIWEVAGDEVDKDGRKRRPPDDRSLPTLWAALALSASNILVGGFVLSSCGDAIADSAGLSSGLVGFLLVSLATSLPEISSMTAAIRIGRYQLAVGDIFGTNLFNILLIFVADLIYSGGPVLDAAGPFEAVGATLAVLLTGIFVVGLLERRNCTILRMGYDSLAALITFAAGVVLLFRLA